LHSVKDWAIRQGRNHCIWYVNFGAPGMKSTERTNGDGGVKFEWSMKMRE